MKMLKNIPFLYVTNYQRDDVLFSNDKIFVAYITQTRKGKFMSIYIYMYLEFIYLFVKNYIMWLSHHVSCAYFICNIIREKSQCFFIIPPRCKCEQIVDGIIWMTADKPSGTHSWEAPWLSKILDILSTSHKSVI